MSTIFDPAFAPLASLPYPAGTGPFRQKGSAWLGDFEFLSTSVPGGLEALFSRLDPSLRSFVQGRFSASEWYDVFPNPALMVVAARMRGKSFVEHQRDVGRWHAKRGFGGIYRSLLRFVSNQNVALWGPRVSGLYHEFGRCESKVAGPNHVHVERKGVPRGLVQWLIVTSGAFCEETLSLGGARSPRLEVGIPRESGEAAGQTLFDVPLDARWD